MKIRIMKYHTETKYVRPDFKTVYSISRMTENGFERIAQPNSCHVFASVDDCRLWLSRHKNDFDKFPTVKVLNDDEIDEEIVDEFNY